MIILGIILLNLLYTTFCQLLAALIGDHLHFCVLPKMRCECVVFSVSVGGERNTNRESGAKGFPVKGVPLTHHQWLLC